jgi:hypothetical protein
VSDVLERACSESLAALYEVHEYRHASAILACEFRDEFLEIGAALESFRFKKDDVLRGGGNESMIPKRMSRILRPRGWIEGSLTAKLVVDDREIRQDTHKVDYVKGRVAFDLEWNSRTRPSTGICSPSGPFSTTTRSALASWSRAATSSIPGSPRSRGIRKSTAQAPRNMGKLQPRLEAGAAAAAPSWSSA